MRKVNTKRNTTSNKFALPKVEFVGIQCLLLLIFGIIYVSLSSLDPSAPITQCVNLESSRYVNAQGPDYNNWQTVAHIPDGFSMT